MGAYLAERRRGRGSRSCRRPTRNDVPIFCPAFTDCSAGFGLVAHQHAARRSGQSQLRQRQGFLRADAAQDHEPDDGHVHDRRRRAQELHAGHRRGGRDSGPRRADAQVRHAGHRRRRPRRRLVQLHAQGGSSWGKVDTVLRADGLQRSDAGRAADRRLRLPQGGWKHRTARRFSRLFEAARETVG